MLTADDIENLVGQTETWRIEFKLARGGLPATFWESYSAFANTDDGVIVLGVQDEGGRRTIVGVSDADKLIQDIWNAVNDTQRISANVLFNRHVYVVSCCGGKVVAVEVPRAERDVRPVYVGRDVFAGAYRRNGEGDYHCTREAVEAMIRDKCPETADTCLMEDMTVADLNVESVRRYRAMFAQLRAEHAWTKIPDDEFLVKIGAARKDLHGVVRPMLSGLVCFGDFVTISNVLPDYFLDYRERLSDETRWTDRVAAHDTDWSGNIFDFYFRIYNRITSDIKVPFKLNHQGVRDEMTPFHKSLRELLANALIHADYHGRRGIVIEKVFNKLLFRNPGCLRMAKEEAIAGGNSDARNAKIFNIFSLINVGERSGMGLSDLFARWADAGYVPPTIVESYDPEQVMVSVQIEVQAEINSKTYESGTMTNSWDSATEKWDFDPVKWDVPSDKWDFANKKWDGAFRRWSIETFLEKIRTQRSTFRNAIVDLYLSLGCDGLLSVAVVKEMESMTHGSANRLMNRLRELNLIVPVTGKGAGKYRFRAFGPGKAE